MRRSALAALAAAALGLAVLLAPPPPASDTGLLGALGRSMGGARVMLINGLFLRAETQRKAGRIDDAAALYETVLELDPGNEAASIFLVNVYIDDLMPQVPDVDERFAWWQEAHALLLRALERRPGSASLHARAASLVLDAVYSDRAFEPRLAAALRRPALVALRHLRTAVEATATLPRQGRGHLLRMVLLAPLLAAEGLRDGDVALYAEARAAIASTLTRRGVVLADMRLREDLALDLRETLLRSQAALDAVRAVRTQGGDRAGARVRIEALEPALPGSEFVRLLEVLLGP